jgi:hypothetical protein
VTDRIPLDHLTSDDLDQLYDERDRLQAQLSDTTRERDRWKWYRDDAERRVRVQRERADQAEAAIACVRAIELYRMPVLGERGRGMQMGWDAALKAVHAALDQPALLAATQTTEPQEQPRV